MGNRRQIARTGIRARRTAIFALTMGMLAVMPVHAQEPTTLPEITVSPATPRSADHKGADGKGGADVKNGDDQSFGDINQKLNRKVDEINPTENNPPLDANSPDTKTGVVNIPSVQQQYGKNFGNSVIPFRPPQPVFSSPLGARK
jgi:hypothetical protein